MGTAEMAFPFIQEAFKKRGVDLQVSHYAACDFDPTFRKVLSSHGDQTRPQHLFGDLAERISKDSFTVLAELQGKHREQCMLEFDAQQKTEQTKNSKGRFTIVLKGSIFVGRSCFTASVLSVTCFECTRPFRPT
jgi:hypothetical protein